MVTPTESAQTAEADGLTGGAIAGIVVGVAVAMIAVIGLAAFFVFKKVRSQVASPLARLFALAISTAPTHFLLCSNSQSETIPAH